MKHIARQPWPVPSHDRRPTTGNQIERYFDEIPSDKLLERLARHVDEEAVLALVGTLDELRGLEGVAAARYFSVWPKLLGPEWGFTARRRQPPPDPVNSLLSFAYTLLFYNVYAMLRARGLHPHVGVVHSVGMALVGIEM